MAGATTRSPTDDDILANAFYPYTLPITVGPGSISVAVTLGAHVPTEVHATSIFSPLVLIASLIGIVAICFLIGRLADSFSPQNAYNDSRPSRDYDEPRSKTDLIGVD